MNGIPSSPLLSKSFDPANQLAGVHTPIQVGKELFYHGGVTAFVPVRWLLDGRLVWHC